MLKNEQSEEVWPEPGTPLAIAYAVVNDPNVRYMFDQLQRELARVARDRGITQTQIDVALNRGSREQQIFVEFLLDDLTERFSEAIEGHPADQPKPL